MQPRTLSMTTLALLAALAISAAPALAQGTTRTLEVEQFYTYPGEGSDMNKLEGFVWPDVDELNALVHINAGGFSGEEKISFFLVVTDPERDDEVISKHKSNHYLPAGSHDIVFPGFMRTGDYFGERVFDLRVEADMDGVAPQQARTSFALEGPDPPEVDILDILIYNPEGGREVHSFEPGGQFAVEVTVEIEDNPAGASPTVVLMAVMEDDIYVTDPELDTQAYTEHWDAKKLSYGEGVIRVRAEGFLPLFYAEPFRFHHDFRVYAIVDFGPGATTTDYASAEVIDFDTGDHRRSEEVRPRLVELERAYKWEADRLRGDRPEPRRFWD